MRATFHFPFACRILLAVFGLLVCLAPLASASDAAHYIALRKRLRCDLKLSYATVQSDPSFHIGRTLELRGVVGGMIEMENGLSVMLNLPDKNAVLLEIPRNEILTVKEMSAANLRVLARVEQGGSGNVVPLRVLAAAHESGVMAIEAQSAARVAALARNAARRYREKEQQRVAPVSRGNLASRGDFIRLAPADVQSMAAYYQPYLGQRTRSIFGPYLQFIANFNRRLTLQQAGQITCSLLHFADRYDIDPRLVVAMVIAESNFNPNSTSRSGAMGLGQLMPGTARALGVSNPYDPVENLRGSIHYLRGRLDNFRDKALPNGGLSFDQVALALAAYNAGPNAVKKYGGVPPFRETQAYVKRVISLYQQLCQ